MIGTYVIENKTLGEGAFGKVKLGVHIHSQQEVAIKLFDKERLKSKKNMLKFNRERKILKKLSHMNIVKVYEVSL